MSELGRAYESTLLFLRQLTDGATAWSPGTEQRILRRIVETSTCPICDAGQGRLCSVFGGMPTLVRTHYQRLPTLAADRRHLLAWERHNRPSA